MVQEHHQHLSLLNLQEFQVILCHQVLPLALSNHVDQADQLNQADRLDLGYEYKVCNVTRKKLNVISLCLLGNPKQFTFRQAQEVIKHY